MGKVTAVACPTPLSLANRGCRAVIRMRILFLSRWFPYPPTNGSKLRIFNLLKQLSQRHNVGLVTFAESTDSVNTETIDALRRYCTSVRVLPYRRFRPTSTRALLGLFAAAPRYLVDTYSNEMRSAVAAEVHKQKPKLVIASQLAMVPYAVELEVGPAVLEELELSMFRPAQGRRGLALRRLRSLLTWLKLSAYLRRTLPRFAACTVASEQERAHLLAVAPWYTAVDVVPNAVDIPHYTGDFGSPCPSTMIFSGALTYDANYDAIRYFLNEIQPAIRQAVPDCLLRITGSLTGVDLASLPRGDGVCFTGYVDDIRPVVAQSWVSVVPLRLGGGTRLKILEALALGTPVVSSSKGAEGLDVTDGEDILIANEPQDFAAKVITLLRSPALRQRLAANGRRLVEARYDWRVVGERLCAVVQRAAA